MSQKSNEFIISITSRDRIGIVFEISSAIASLNGNITDSHQSVMGGYYTMIMHTIFPEGMQKKEIDARLKEVDANSPTPLNILVQPVEDGHPPKANPETHYVITASGVDQVGFVAKVAGFCVKYQINIVDLSTTLSSGDFVMMLEVDLSQCPSISEVRNALSEFGKSQNLKIVMQHYDIFKAVNEISLPIRPNHEVHS